MAKTIMIVDDSASIRTVVGIALRGEGYAVIEAINGQDAINKLTRLLSSDGLLVVQSNNAAKRVNDFEEQLSQLNDRMTKMLERYNKQFAAMESMVGQSKSLQTSLKSTFDNMNSSSNN